MDVDNEVANSSLRRKGKARADPEEALETTPLLGSSHSLIQEVRPPSVSHRGRQLLVLLSLVFISSLGLCILIALILLAIAYSYNSKITNTVREDVLNHAVLIQGPDRIGVLNATEGSLWLQVGMRVGIDAGRAIDIILSSRNNDGLGAGITTVQRVFSRWFVRQMETITISSAGVAVFSRGIFLSNATTSPFTLPLSLNTPENLSWLTSLSLPVHVNFTKNSTDLMNFVKESWESGYVSLNLDTYNATIDGGNMGEVNWRKRLHLFQDEISIPLRIKIPSLPGLPDPGTSSPFPGLSDLITLESFNVSSVNNTVSVRASASLINPIPASFHAQAPELPFTVSLPDINSSRTSVVVTTGHVAPFLTTHPNISLTILGTVPSLPRSSAPLLSAFLSNYLAGIDAPIRIGSPLLPALELPAVFPAPHPKPKILRHVRIQDMRISIHGETFLASGTVYAQVVLPTGIHVGVDAQKIWPDVLVFDGEVPDGDEEEHETLFNPPKPTSTSNEKIIHSNDGEATIPKEPLPSPLPPRAFARIRPDDWLLAHSEPIPGTGAAYEVTAEVEDVPLEVLPGRDHLLRNFIGKVVFGGKEGALAGVKGTAAVAVVIDGLPLEDNGPGHVMELTGLPFSGSFRVGRKAM